MTDTPNLKMPYLMAAQAQKHVTHNEALRALDAVVQLAVMDRDLTAPPASPTDGHRFIVASGSTADWSGKDLQIAAFQDNAWMFYQPLEGWLAFVSDEDKLLAYDGSSWTEVSGGAGATNPAALIGVNTIADTSNRLSVSSPNSLFSHEGSDHRVKINKAALGDTASFLFQSNWSGRAEFGLVGNDEFTLKTSADGASWQNVLEANTSTGNMGVGSAPSTTEKLRVRGDLMCDSTNGSFKLRADGTIDASRFTGGGIYIRGRTAGSDLYFGATTSDGTLDNGLLKIDAGGTGGVNSGVIPGADLYPDGDNARSNGTSSKRWSVVYSATGTINTSDKRLKTKIRDCDLGLSFINSLRPIAYRWKVGSQKVTRSVEEKTGLMKLETSSVPGKRTHYGLLAQEVKAALQKAGVEDFAGWTLAKKSDPDSTQGLRYEQLIPALIKAIQELSNRVSGPEQR